MIIPSHTPKPQAVTGSYGRGAGWLLKRSSLSEPEVQNLLDRVQGIFVDLSLKQLLRFEKHAEKCVSLVSFYAGHISLGGKSNVNPYPKPHQVASVGT